jgi:hypothetical protein
VPLVWLWLASQLQKSSEPSFGPYLVVGVGIGVSAFVIVKGLVRRRSRRRVG